MASASFHPFLPVMISGKMLDIKMLHDIFKNGRLPLDIRIKCAISHAVLGNAGGMHTCRVEGGGDPVILSVRKFLRSFSGLLTNGGKRYA